MGLLVLLALALVGCAVLAFGAAMNALARVRELKARVTRQGDEIDDLRRQLSWLRTTATERTTPPPSLAPPPSPDFVQPPQAPVATPVPAPPPRVPPTAAEWAHGGSGLKAQGPGPSSAQGLEETQCGPGPRTSWVENFDWENLVGVKLFSWVAGIALTLAAVFFLRHSIQVGWLQPPVRMAIGLFVGIVLLAVCEMKVAGNYRVTANAMDAAGIAILFATFFAAFALWHLVGSVPAFAGLGLVTAIAVVLSIRRDSLFIAGLGLVGGFITPALLSTGQDNPLGLFGYLFVLNAGLAWVAYRKRWPWLTAASVALTTVYQWAWVYRFMRPDRIPLAALIFLAFPALNAAALAVGLERDDDRHGKVFGKTSDLGAALPLLFAMYLVATPGYAEHRGFVFGFLLCLCAGLFALALARRQGLLHVAGGASAFVVVNTYLVTSYHPDGWPGVLAWLTVFIVFFLAAEWIGDAVNRPLGGVGARGTLTAPFLILAFAALAGLEPATREPWLLFGLAFALSLAVAAVEFRFGRPWLRMAAATSMAIVFFTWLAVHRRPELAIALAGAWAALAIAVARWGRTSGSAKRGTLDAPVFAAVFTALLVATFAGLKPNVSVGALTAGHVVFGSALLWIATERGWYRVVPALVLPGAIGILLWVLNYPPPVPWQSQLLLVGGIYAVFFSYPLLAERRAAAVTEPWLASVLASGLFFLVARDSLVRGGFESIIGLLPLAQAALTGILLWRLLRLEPAGRRRTGRLALVAGALLAFVTLAVALQLEKQWLTIGCALEAASLAWLYRRIPHRGLLAACLALIAAVLARLTVNPDLIAYHERGPRILNWYLYTYLVSALAAFAAGRFLETTDDAPVRGVAGLPRGASLAKASGIVLLFALVNVEIADFYSVGPNLSFHFSATLAQDLTYTLAWAAFGVALLVAGIVARSHAARVAALMLLVVTVLKGFLHDLADLGGLYRVFSFVGLAACLSLVALVLQKFVLQRPGNEPRPPHSPSNGRSTA